MIGHQCTITLNKNDCDSIQVNTFAFSFYILSPEMKDESTGKTSD
jgi:hypothetical protein